MGRYYLDLFSGIGGFALGAYYAGMTFDGHYFSEIDPYAIKVYGRNFPDAIPLGNITKIKGEDLPRGDWYISGGFPCQDISVAGKNAGLDGSRSGLWFEYARLIGEIRPEFVLVENVGALTVRGLDRVLGSLAQIGYDAEWQDIRAGDLGAPHRRERIWIVAYPKIRESGEPPKWEERESPSRRSKKRLSGDVADTYRELRDRAGEEWDRGAEFANNGQPVANANGLRLEHVSKITDGAGEQNIPGEPERSCPVMANAEFQGLEGYGGNAGEPEFAKSGNDGPSVSSADGKRLSMPGTEQSSERIGGCGEIPDAGDAWSVKWQRECRGDKQTGGGGEDNGGGAAVNACREWWAVEPGLDRVAYGIPHRVDRLKCLGNSIVPGIAELIWRGIKETL